MIKFREQLPTRLNHLLIDEMNTYNGGEISVRFNKLLTRSTVWFATRIDANPDKVGVELSVLTGTQRDKGREIHEHPTDVWNLAISSKRILNSGTVIFDGLEMEKVEEHYSNYEKICRFRENLPINPDVEEFVDFSKISRHPRPIRESNNNFDIFQPDNGQIVTFDLPHAAPSLPKGTVRLLLTYDGN